MMDISKLQFLRTLGKNHRQSKPNGTHLQPKEHLAIVAVQSLNNWPIPGIP